MKNAAILSITMLFLSVSVGQAQLAFTDNSVAAGVNYSGNGGGVSFGDYNNDGFVDFYVVNEHGGDGILFRNNGDGTFTNVSVAAGVSGVLSGEGGIWIDHDRNGFLDIYVANEAGPNFLYHNNGDNTFTEISTATGSGNLGTTITGIVADFNNDGAEDIYVINLGANALLQGDFDGNFVDVTSRAGVGNSGDGLSGSWGEFDGDGYDDLYVVNRSGSSNIMYMNNGDGTFTDNTPASGTGSTKAGYGTAVGDYDNDGDLDIYVSNWGANELFQNDGSGVFTEVAASAGVNNSQNALGVSFGDLDNDGDLDIYVVNQDGANALYINDGSGVFTDEAASAGVEDAAGAALGTAFGDIDNDGFLDIYVSNFEGQNVLYVNDGNANHYINVTLKGLANNVVGFGSVITLISGSDTLTRVVEGGGGFSSHNSIPVEFGLGSATSVDSIIVNWPYGRSQTVVPTGVDTSIVIIEDIYEHDLIAGSILGIPSSDKIVDGDSFSPSALIVNIGDSAETGFDVIMTIALGTDTIYSDTVNYSGLVASLEKVNIAFPAWTPPEEGTYDIGLVVDLTGDQSLVNNSISISSTISFAVSPTVTSTNPADGATNVPAATPVIESVFSESIEEASANSSTFSAVGSVSGAIPGAVIYSSGAKKILLLVDGSFDFASEEVVTVTASGDILSLFGLGVDGDLDGESEGSPTDDFVWTFTIETITGIEDAIALPEEYSLSQNHPNPFNPSTTIEFALSEAGEVILTIFDINGREIERLAEGYFQGGYHSLTWDARGLSSGIYFYRLSTKNFVQTKKLMLLK